MQLVTLAFLIALACLAGMVAANPTPLNEPGSPQRRSHLLITSSTDNLGVSGHVERRRSTRSTTDSRSSNRPRPAIRSEVKDIIEREGTIMATQYYRYLNGIPDAPKDPSKTRDSPSYAPGLTKAFKWVAGHFRTGSSTPEAALGKALTNAVHVWISTVPKGKKGNHEDFFDFLGNVILIMREKEGRITGGHSAAHASDSRIASIDECFDEFIRDLGTDLGYLSTDDTLFLTTWAKTARNVTKRHIATFVKQITDLSNRKR
jgi:hypothetical protein